MKKKKGGKFDISFPKFNTKKKPVKQLKVPFKFSDEVTVLESKKFKYDRRYVLLMKELNHATMDAIYAGKKAKKSIELNLYRAINPVNVRKEIKPYTNINYMDISYMLFMVDSSVEFPHLTSIKDPFHKHKAAFVKVGDEVFDYLPKVVQKRDLKFVKDFSDWISKDLVGYRINRRVYERLLTRLSEESNPSLGNHGIEKGSPVSIYYPLQASNAGQMNFFNYVNFGFVVMKDSSCYMISEPTVFTADSSIMKKMNERF